MLKLKRIKRFEDLTKLEFIILLFLMASVLYDRHHVRLVRYYVGIIQLMPLFSGLFLFFSLANMGLPGTNTFVEKILAFLAIIKRSPLAAFIAD